MHRYEIYEDAAGEWRVRFVANNGEIVFSTEGYSTKSNARRAVRAIKEFAAYGEIVDDDGAD